MTLPLYKDMLGTVLQALDQLGGTAKTSDVECVVADILKLTPAEREVMHVGKKTKLHYRVAWARFALKKEGLLESSVARGTSTLSEKGKEFLATYSAISPHN